MSETYRKIYPGNCVTHLSAYALPNESFKENNRAVGDPRDRKTQALLFTPGWLAIRKVAHSLITTPAKDWDAVVGSPDLRPDDKPRADIKGLLVPSDVLLVRAGLRVSPLNANPGYYSSGARNEASKMGSGLVGTAGDTVFLASDPGAAQGVLSASSICTNGDIEVDADGNLPVGVDLLQTEFGAPLLTTADMILKLYASGSGISSTLTGGCYVISEVVYLVPEELASIEDTHVEGARMSGFGS
jgi:hypothetical protein